MSYIATIKRMSDGLTRDVPLEFDWDRGEGLTDEFRWEEGNLACDCNRALLMDDEDNSCGDRRYKVRITLPDGSVPCDEMSGE